MRTHGLSGSRVYSLYVAMLTRCTNPNAINFSDYGGRGIDVCDRWFDSFENFFEDMGHPPSKEHSLDRINGNGNYETGNCRWATAEEQANNKSNTIRLAHDGRVLSAKQWSRELCIPYKTLYWRLKHGWDSQRALATPARPYRRSPC